MLVYQKGIYHETGTPPFMGWGSLQDHRAAPQRLRCASDAHCFMQEKSFYPLMTSLSPVDCASFIFQHLPQIFQFDLLDPDALILEQVRTHHPTLPGCNQHHMSIPTQDALLQPNALPVVFSPGYVGK